MGNFFFRKIIGPRADINELEYVVALHQTCFPLRVDATVSAQDIAMLLKSRYGMILSPSDAMDIVRALGGTKIPMHTCDDESVLSLSDAADTNSSHLYEIELDHLDRIRADRVILEQFGLQSPSSIIQNEDVCPENLSEGPEIFKNEANFDGKDNRANATRFASNHRSRENRAENVEELLDLVQLYSCLLIPTLLKAAATSCRKEQVAEREVDETQFGLPEHNSSSTSRNNSIVAPLHRFQKYIFFRQKELDERTHLLRVRPCHIIRDVLRIMMASLDSQAFNGDVLCHSLHSRWERNNGVEARSHPYLPTYLPPLPQNHIPLSVTFLRMLLLQYGETDAASDDSLIHDMILCAGSDSLSEESFARALTADIERWETGMEDNISTTFYDVFHAETTIGLQYNRDPKQNTSPFIDYVFDTHYSAMFVVLLWVYYLFSLPIYLSFLEATGMGLSCDPSFWCSFSKQLILWLLVAVMLTLAGILIIIPISLANSPYAISARRGFFSCLYLVVLTVIPILSIKVYSIGVTQSANGLISSLQGINSSLSFRVETFTYLALGLLLFVVITVRFFINFTEHYFTSILPPRLRIFLLSSDNVRSSVIKEAATHRINSMLFNARAVHLVRCNDSALKSSTIKEFNPCLFERYDEWNGFRSTWNVLFCNEYHGIWIHSRLAIGLVGQLIVFVLVLVFGLIFIERAAVYYDNNRMRVSNEPPGVLREFALQMLPEGWMIRRSCYTGLGFAILDGIVLILLYIPSTVTTIVQLRCGYLPSLRDPLFSHKYRSSADTITYNVGNMIFGMLGSQGLFFLFFAGIIFLFLWPVTSSHMVLFAAWFLGLMITICLKSFLMLCCRKAYFIAFYRKNVAEANLSSLAMEAWNLGLGGGVLLSRLSQFLLASAFWLGRVDCFLLDEDVQLLGYRFDTAPINFRKEILVHEAHRHPFIDRLAGVYLARVKHGQRFSTNAGATWRRLFVLILHPWMSRNLALGMVCVLAGFRLRLCKLCHVISQQWNWACCSLLMST